MLTAASNDSLKKSRMQYMKCREGGLHDGELLNFVCVDTKCEKKGLICPVCRMNEHEEHKVIPLKLFLSEMQGRFTRQTNESELNSLSDYLRTLDKTKRQLLEVVRDTVSQIAQKVRKVEATILENYSNIRKMVLTQSTIAHKLPSLIGMMLGQTEKEDPNSLHAEFQKYAELLQYEGEKVEFYDNCRKIVEDYANLPGTITAHLSTLIPQLTKIFDSLPLAVDNNKTVKAPKLSYTFSEISKNKQIVVTSKKEVTINADTYESGGYVFVGEGLGTGHQAIAFKITGNGSGCVSVGMGVTDVIKAKQYQLSGKPIQLTSDSDSNHGAYVISSMGVNFQHKQPEKQESQQSFVFSQDDIIEVEWNDKTKKLQFGRRNGLEKFTMDINLPESELPRLQFMVGVFQPEDKVAIVD